MISHILSLRSCLSMSPQRGIDALGLHQVWSTSAHEASPWGKRPVFADSAYRSEKREAELAQQNILSQICEKGSKGHPLSEKQQADNHEKSKVRSRVEHLFGAQAQMGGHWVRTIGLPRTKIKIGCFGRGLHPLPKRSPPKPRPSGRGRLPNSTSPWRVCFCLARNHWQAGLWVLKKRNRLLKRLPGG
ncbi:MAG: hypothetical protein CVU16_08445 [Betaproteobacteria bacterium HGW-Betaproteobacteria-10]|nr:MAG: hypothetical protein CVU16_08445 [Betaproteobacteria bacterium HGW-Betaproteobacteria-10]